MVPQINERNSSLTDPPTNPELAIALEDVAELLLEQGANPFRASAYRRAATAIRQQESPLWQIYERDGLEGLEQIKGVGRTISRALQQLIRGGKWALQQRLQGNDVAEQAFASVPGIGPKLAKRIHDELGLETLAELQAAAWDGRLDKMPGMGPKRVRAVRESLAARGRVRDSFGGDPRSTPLPENRLDLTMEIPVSELLEIDREYRDRADRGVLPRIAPRQNNPQHEFWLPVFHVDRGDRHYTALFSNTAHAHQMGTTHDWVVIYLEDHQRGQQGRWTVITSQFGKMRGLRIVRGREGECADYYQNRPFHP